MYQKPSEKSTYMVYQHRCNKPKNYHRYQSNLCDPTQDYLPITMPNPNEGIPDIKLNNRKEEIIYNLKYGSQICTNRFCNCEKY